MAKLPRSGVYHGHFSGPVSFKTKPKPPNGLKVEHPSSPAGDLKRVDTGNWMTPFVSKRDYQFRG